MPSATLTSKGQTTIPKEVRDHLGLRAGDRIDFIVRKDGTVILQPATRDIRDLYGILAKAGQRPVAVAEMNEAIRKRFGKR